MRFRTRLIVAMSFALAATLTASFTAVSVVVARSEEHQLDEALRAEAHEEVIEIARREPFAMRISARTGAEADVFGRLPRFAALYASGRVVDRTPGLRQDPTLDPSEHAAGVPFDLDVGGEGVRAVLAHVPDHPDLVLLMGSTRAELERDVRFLREVMAVTALVSILFAIMVSYSIARGLTRDHAAIAAVARRVGRGELDARVALRTGDDETAQLAADIDRMIERLETLVGSQQRFVAHAAHELRSPLTALYGELQLALRRERSAEEYRAAIDQALGSAKRLIALAEDLLALARLGSEDASGREDVDARDCVERAISWARAPADARGIRIEVEGPSAAVHGRRTDLERMVRNLVDNAVRHSPDGGSIRVTLAPREGGVEIAVEDEGPGVPASDRTRIFEPFFRSDGARADASGSGLGLPIAREIARAHGGDVVLDDAGERGARFVASVCSPRKRD